MTKLVWALVILTTVQVFILLDINKTTKNNQKYPLLEKMVTQDDLNNLAEKIKPLEEVSAHLLLVNASIKRMEDKFDKVVGVLQSDSQEASQKALQNLSSQLEGLMEKVNYLHKTEAEQLSQANRIITRIYRMKSDFVDVARAVGLVHKSSLQTSQQASQHVLQQKKFVQEIRSLQVAEIKQLSQADNITARMDSTKNDVINAVTAIQNTSEQVLLHALQQLLQRNKFDEEIKALNETGIKQLSQVDNIARVTERIESNLDSVTKSIGDVQNVSQLLLRLASKHEKQQNALDDHIKALNTTELDQAAQLQSICTRMKSLKEELVENTTTAIDSHTALISSRIEQQDKRLQLAIRVIQDVRANIMNKIKFLHCAHSNVRPKITITSSVSVCTDKRADTNHCQLPVSITRRTVTITGTCSLPTCTSSYGDTELVLDGPLVWEQWLGDVFLNCSKPTSQANVMTCMLHNLTKVNAVYDVNFTCTWLGHFRARKTVTVGVTQALAVGLDIGTQTIKAMYYNENKTLKALKLSNRSDGLLPSTVWVCRDRHYFGVEMSSTDGSDGCFSIDDLKVKVGDYYELYELDLRTLTDEHTATEIGPRCKHSAESSRKCNLTVARWSCTDGDGRDLQQAINTTVVMASLIQYVTADIQHQLGGGPVGFAYTSPFELRQHQSRALFDAIRIAGTENTTMLLHIPETAAAATYILNDPQLDLPKTKLLLLVLDFGHGTSAINLLSKGPDYGLRIVHGGGLPNVGGRQFDRGLADLLNEQLEMAGRSERITPQMAEKIKRQVNLNGLMTVHGINVTNDTLKETFRETMELPLITGLDSLLREPISDDEKENVRFSYADLQSGKGLVLVVGGMSRLNVLKDFLISFFRVKSTVDRPIIVKFPSEYMTDDDGDSASFRSIVAKGAALMVGIHTKHLDKNFLNFPLQTLAGSTFMSIRIRERVKGMEKCRMLIQYPARAADRNTSAIVVMNVTKADSEDGDSYVNLQNALCQSTDSFSKFTDCADCLGSVSLENATISLDVADVNSANISIMAVAEENRDLKLYVNVSDVRDTILSRGNFTTQVLSFNDGHYSEEERKVHRETARKLLHSTSNYPACSMFYSDDAPSNFGRPALQLEVECCYKFPCSWARSTGNVYRKNQHFIQIPHGRNLSCAWKILTPNSKMLDALSNSAVIFDQRDLEIGQIIRRSLTKLNLTVSLHADTNVNLLLLALNRKEDRLILDEGDDIWTNKILSHKMGANDGNRTWGQKFNASLEAVVRKSDSTLHLWKALPSAVDRVCKDFQKATHKASTIVVISSGTSGSDSRSWAELKSTKLTEWTKPLSCFAQLEERPTLWTLLIKGSESSNDSDEIEAVHEFLNYPGQIIAAKPVQRMAGYSELERKLVDILRLAGGEQMSDLSLDIRTKGSGYMECKPGIERSSEHVVYHLSTKTAQVDDEKRWLALQLDHASLYNGALTPVQCLVGSDSKDAFRISATLRYRSTNAGGAQEQSNTLDVEIASQLFQDIVRDRAGSDTNLARPKWVVPFLNKLKPHNKANYSVMRELRFYLADGFTEADDAEWCAELGWTQSDVQETLSNISYTNSVNVTVHCQLDALPAQVMRDSTVSWFTFPSPNPVSPVKVNESAPSENKDDSTTLTPSGLISLELKAVPCGDINARCFNVTATTGANLPVAK